jgi:hypothetical protein
MTLDNEDSHLEGTEKDNSDRDPHPLMTASIIAEPHLMGAMTLLKISGQNSAAACAVSVRLAEESQKVLDGDLSEIERMLVVQAKVVNALMIDASDKCATARHHQAAQVYGSIALKAHATCRQTLLTFAELKNPKEAAPTTALQVNIDARETKTENELLKAGQNATLDN